MDFKGIEIMHPGCCMFLSDSVLNCNGSRELMLIVYK